MNTQHYILRDTEKNEIVTEGSPQSILDAISDTLTRNRGKLEVYNGSANSKAMSTGLFVSKIKNGTIQKEDINE